MIDLKKKCWRDKVTAEITLAHVVQFARESGIKLSEAELASFLNQNGRAQGIWMHMMQAAEQYIKSSLTASEVKQASKVGFPPFKPTATHVGLVN